MYTERSVVDRLACVSIPFFSLQLLLMERPDWEEFPCALVSEDKPNGIILELNRAAYGRGIRRGMRFSSALSLTPVLRAGCVSRDRVESGIATVLTRLQAYSPRVETCAFEPGVFWLDASGLEHLYPSLAAWMEGLSFDLCEMGFRPKCSIGFSRFGTYTAAKCLKGHHLFTSSEEERETVDQAPLSILPLTPKIAGWLRKLGVNTVSSFLRLPSGAVRTRFGREAEHLHSLASGVFTLPLQHKDWKEPFQVGRVFSSEISDVIRLIEEADLLLSRLISRIVDEKGLLRKIELTLTLDDGREIEQVILPTQPTREHKLLSTLIRLRLETLSLSGSVVGLRMNGARVESKHFQVSLFPSGRRRDLSAGSHAFALIRAEYGNDAVQRAVLNDSHLPEERFSWRSMKEPAFPCPRVDAGNMEMRLVRRHFDADKLFEKTFTYHPCGGPFVVNSGWWDRPVRREYHYMEGERDGLVWIYRDLLNSRWTIQGCIE